MDVGGFSSIFLSFDGFWTDFGRIWVDSDVFERHFGDSLIVFDDF